MEVMAIYNQEVEAIRDSEYPMLKGPPRVPFFKSTKANS